MGNITPISTDECTTKPTSTTSILSSSSSPNNVRLLQNVLLIWLDENINGKNEHHYQKHFEQLRRIVNSIHPFDNINRCINFLVENQDEKIFLILTDSLGRKVLPRIHTMSQVNSIFIYSQETNADKQWIKDWSKIKGLFTDISSICDILKQSVKQCERNSISMSLLSSNTDNTTTTNNRKANPLGPSFIYTQILKEILLTIEFEQDHFNEFIDFCRQLYKEKNQLDKVEKFQHEYHNQTPIWWYTSDSFLYPMLNRALRVMDIDIIIRMGFFVGDLHRQLEQLHTEQFRTEQSNHIFTLYRGQVLSLSNFKQIQENNVKLISFNNFLSTSKNRNVSMGFAVRALTDTDKDNVGILFVMTIDANQSTTPFASIEDVSCYGDKEEEVLFSMHTVFRITKITQIPKKPRLYQIDLTLTNDNDNDCRILVDCIRERTEGTTGWDRLGQLLLNVGEPIKAEQVYEILLKQTTDEKRQGYIYHRLGSAKYNQGKYQEAIKLYKQGLTIRQKTLPPNHPDIAMSHNNIGNVYSTMSMYSKALLSHEKALEIRLYSLSPTHPDLAMSYDNIGSVCYYMGEYSEALSSHKKALAIRQRSFPSNHPDLAISYNNIGMIYRSLGKYSEALLSFEHAVNIGQDSLPTNHPHLQTYRQNFDLTKKIL